jgi:hypothetical protein
MYTKQEMEVILQHLDKIPCGRRECLRCYPAEYRTANGSPWRNLEAATDQDQVHPFVD